MTSRKLLDRRSALMIGAAFALGGLPLRADASVATARERTLAFLNLHTGERLQTTYWAEGRYIAPALQEIDVVLRDFRTGEVAEIDPRLLDLLQD